jgi:hypothetical protein
MFDPGGSFFLLTRKRNGLAPYWRNREMRQLNAACGIVFGALWSLHPDIGQAQGADGTYRGALDCAQLPFTKGPQRVSLEVQVSSGRAGYSREVYNETRTAVVGTETGSGTVSADGTMSMSGNWRGVRDSFSASYSGKLSASGGQLSGRQNWSYKGQSYARSCSITLTR